MSMRRVRIYPGNDSESNLLSFSASAADAPGKPAFTEFMEGRGYTTRQADLEEIPETHIGGWLYVEVRPPLSEEHIRELGILCTGGMIDGQPVEAIVDPYHDGTL